MYAYYDISKPHTNYTHVLSHPIVYYYLCKILMSVTGIINKQQNIQLLRY